MDQLFYEAYRKRRNREYGLTSTFTNAIYYGSPAWAKKKSIWPPLSRHDAFTDREDDSRDVLTKVPSTIPSKLGARSSPETARGSTLGQYGTKTDLLYHALHRGSIVRVLEIKAGSFSSPIICKFHYADLDALHLEYDALSYVWSKPTFGSQTKDVRTVTVQCNGHELKISPNLEQAIRHVRSTSRSTFLWADAMCINQDDSTEREHQVSLMAYIYRRARRTIIWLGDAPVGSGSRGFMISESEDVEAQRAFGAICDVVNHWKSLKTTEAQGGFEAASYRIANAVDNEDSREPSRLENDPSNVTSSTNPEHLLKAMQQQHGLINGGRRDMDEWDDDVMHVSGDTSTRAQGSSSSNPKPEPSDPGIDADVASAPTSPLWKSVASLFSRPWFWRIWVIQEVVLAQSAVVKWGHAEMDWRWIGLASAILRTNYSSICEVMKMGGVYNAYFMFRLSPMSDLPPLTLSFIQLLRLTRQFEVTDVRDRIYGLLGIRTTDNDPEAGLLFLRPDYSISECELWKRLATKVIGESQNLSLLSSVQYTTEGFEAGNSASERLFRSMLSDDRYPTEPLPSWVPHWDLVYRSTLAPWDHDDRFAAAKDFPLHLGSPMGSDNLLVEGIKIGVVGRCCGYMWHQADTALLESKAMGDFFTSDDGLRLLARTLTAGRNAYGSLTAADSGRDSESCLADFAAYILDCDRNEREGREKRPWSTYHDKDWTARSYQKVFERHPQLKKRLEKLAEGRDMSRFYNSVVSICKRRRLFITLNGYLGLGSDSVIEGDVVCVLSGADLPFVLRPVLRRRETNNDDKNTEQLRPDELPQIDHYVLVGECYVEGLMNGEAVAAVTGGSDPSEFSGPVPFQLLEEDILSAANEPEEVITQGLMAEIKRTKMKQARLDAGDLFTPAMVEAARRTRAEKQWFNIH